MPRRKLPKAEKGSDFNRTKCKNKNQIIVFKNKDKEGWYEEWQKGRDLMNFPHPFRMIISANPGSGKTNMIKNVIVRAKPYFKRIYLCHFDEQTKEYDDIDVIKLDEIPDSRSTLFRPSIKSLLIIDDYDFKSLNYLQLNNLRSLFKYGSTHRGLSIIIATQDFFHVPSIIRRLSNVYFIWRGSSDLDSLWQIGRRVGYTKEEFRQLMDLCCNKFDQICIDMTVSSPAPVRYNGYTLVKSEKSVLDEIATRKSQVQSVKEAEDDLDDVDI